MRAMSDLPAPLDEHVTREMVRRMQAGDGDAWRELYGRYRDELLLLIRVNMGTRLRAALQSEDVLQSVVLEAFRAMPRFEDRGQGSLRAYLKVLLLQKVRGHGRALAAKKRAGAASLTSTLARALPAAEATPAYQDARYGKIETALRALPADMREVIVLRRLDGVSNEEAAARLGRSAEATRKLYARAMARLSLLVQAAP
jgi:RNA polymerase sigma-70 factor (ECF subfamily)